MFGGFHVFAGSLIKLRPKKKVQLSGCQLECLGVPWAWIVLAGSLIKLRPKKRYSCLAIGCNVWGVPWTQIVLAGLLLCFLVGSLIKLQITAGKKGIVVWSLVGMSTMYFWLILNGGHFSGELIVIEINTETEYNSNLQIGMALSLSKKIMAFSLSNIEIHWFFFQVDT